MIVHNAMGDDDNEYNENVVEQKTCYLYESEFDASWVTTVVYPDTADSLDQDGNGAWTFDTDNGDHVETTYDRLGRVVTTTDQRGVVHTYEYDSAGRLSHDRVTSLGASGLVDDAVLRVTTTYDDVGRVRSVTNYDNHDPAFGSVVNQVEYTYNSWGLLIEEEQDHDPGQSSPSVQYTYDDGVDSGVAKYVRLEKVTYPAGREVSYSYNHGTDGAVDEVMSRISAIFDDADEDGVPDTGEVHASYKYLGAGTIVAEDYELPQVRLDLNTDSNLGGLDRFGRVVDQFWEDYGATATIDQFLYDYDRAGNLTDRDNSLHSDNPGTQY